MTTTAFIQTKGGVGCSVTAAGFAIANAKLRPTLLVDRVDGDQRVILGLPRPMGDRYRIEVTENLELCTMETPMDNPTAATHDLVIDAGFDHGMARGADRVLLVLRQCYLALNRSMDLDCHPTGVVLLEEEGRALVADDVARALGLPVVLRRRLDPRVARAVDAGLLLSTPTAMLRDLVPPAPARS